MIEKRVAQNKDSIVKNAEAIIQAQATIFQGTSSDEDSDESVANAAPDS